MLQWFQTLRCAICVFLSTVSGKMKLFAVLWFLVWPFLRPKFTRRPYKQCACFYVQNTKKCLGILKSLKYHTLILRNANVKTQNKCKSTWVAVYCHFCGSREQKFFGYWFSNLISVQFCVTFLRQNKVLIVPKQNWKKRLSLYIYTLPSHTLYSYLCQVKGKDVLH